MLKSKMLKNLSKKSHFLVVGLFLDLDLLLDLDSFYLFKVLE